MCTLLRRQSPTKMETKSTTVCFFFFQLCSEGLEICSSPNMKKASNELVWSLTTVRWIPFWVRSALNKNWFASPPKFSLQNYTLFRALSECTRLEGPPFSPECNEKLLVEDAGQRQTPAMMILGESIFLHPPYQHQMEELDSPDLPVSFMWWKKRPLLCCLSQEDGWMWREAETWKCSPINIGKKNTK